MDGVNLKKHDLMLNLRSTFGHLPLKWAFERRLIEA